MFEYRHFTCDGGELEARLNHHGRDGWRLHTCEPIVLVDQTGQPSSYCFVVMDRLVAEDEDEAAERRPIGGMEMRG